MNEETVTLQPADMEAGVWVNYVLGNEFHYPGEVRPALVVKVWGAGPHPTVNLLVFVDGGNDLKTYDYQRADGNTVWKTSRVYAEDKRLDSYHFPDRGYVGVLAE